MIYQTPVRSNELYHHGILGMRWGVRRFQNKDGTYTEAGKKHRSGENVKKKQKNQRPDISKIPDAELQKRVNRLALEKRYYDLMRESVRNAKNDSPAKQEAKRFIAQNLKKYGNKVVNAAVMAGAAYATNKLMKDQDFKYVIESVLNGFKNLGIDPNRIKF